MKKQITEKQDIKKAKKVRKNKDIPNKQTETKARNRVFNKQNFFKVLIALVVLTSVLLSALLGVSKAEYFKTLSKKVNLDLKPDLVLEYYLYDYDDHESRTTDDLKPEFGSYKNAEQITQMIKIGRPDSSSKMLQNDDDADLETAFYGKDIVYQIKIPVTETGYYTLNFTSEFIRFTNPTLKPNDEYIEQDYYTTSYRKAVGCEVLNVENTNNYETYKFGTPTPLDLAERVFANKVFYEKQGYTADSAFQWKTLSPTRSESVKLSFKVNKEDVDNGYVVWMWELTGLRGNAGYTLSCDHLEIEKIMELDGSTSKRDSDAPYFMTPKTTITNAQIRVLGKVSDEEKAAGADGTGNYERRGSVVPGKTSYSDGRGSYVTEATPNSVGMRIETLNSGVLVNNKTTWYYDNPTSFQIPIKNIKYDTTYKVTFDFSVARQGNLAPSQLDTSSKYDTSDTNMWDYTNYDKILNRTNLAPEFNSGHGSNENNSYFFSYLHDDIASLDSNKNIHKVTQSNSSKTIDFNATRITNAEHITGSQKLYYKYKQHQGEALTKYNGILDYSGASSSHNYLNMVSSTTVNDTYSIEYFNSGGDANLDSTLMRNHFNAVQHTEINGQVAINWLTFYNTTFSFNIDGDAHQKKDANGNLLYLDENGDETTTVTDKPAYNIDINNLNWVWAIDALEYECFYNIRIDNIRIQEVVEYSSMIDLNGLKIADKVESTEYDADHYGTGLTGGADASVFNNFKGYNNIGQNYQAKRNDTKTDGTKKHMSVGNIYAPIFDAKRMSAKAPQTADGKPHPDDYKIRLSGWAVLNGGVSKYVFSIDGGYTWYDMTFEGTSDSSADLFAKAQEGIHQNTYLQSYANYGKGTTHDFYFDKQDALNDNFGNFALTADLTDFKNQADLDIIIAAVPYVNEDLRCEIIRIINYNSANTYVSKLDSISSDIETSTGILTVTNDKMAYNTATSGTSTHKKAHYYPVFERGSYDNRLSANSITSTNRPMAKSENIDFSTIRTTYSDIPVKTQLTLKGVILCSQGVYAYEYSIDGGKTWKECTYTMTGFTAGTDYYNIDYKADDKEYHSGENLMYKFITRNLAIGNKQNYMPSNSGKFSTDASAISIDLSAYKGQVVDIIVAAKPNYLHNYVSRYSGDPRTTDIHLPIAKIDNVAVYGATGTFYTHLNSVSFDGEIIEPTYLDADDKPLNRVTKSTSDSTVTVTPQWDLGYSAKDGKEFSYTIFEPNNVNALHARFYNNEVNEVQSGSRIVLNGYTVMQGQIQKYMYTIDGGETWNEIYRPSNTANSNDNISYAKQSDSDFSNFNNTYYGDGCELEFSIPALPEGTEINLTVIAVNNNDDRAPVFSIKLKMKDENVGYFYNCNSNVHRSSGNYVNNSAISQYFSFQGSWYPTYKMTFPVEREGVHTLSFDTHIDIYNSVTESNPSSASENMVINYRNLTVTTSYENFRDDLIVVGSDAPRSDTNHYPGWAFGEGSVNMAVSQTHYESGEKMKITYSWDVINYHYKNDSYTKEHRPAINGAYILLYPVNNIGTLNGGKPCRTFAFEGLNMVTGAVDRQGAPSSFSTISAGRTDISPYTTRSIQPETTFEFDLTGLPAGQYKLMFLNFGPPDLNTWYLPHMATNFSGNAHQLLTDEIDITISNPKSRERKMSAAIVHDETAKGQERFYASNERITNLYTSTDSRVDDNARWETSNAYDSSKVELFFNATAEDVKRGYVVLAFDLDDLKSTESYQYIININNLSYGYGVKSTKKLVTDRDGNASNIIRVPALEVGTHEFMFSSDTHLFGGPIVHLGIDQTVTLEDGVPGDEEGRNKGGNYRAAGAYMSVEKNVFNVGEPIHVSYCSAGTVTTSNTTQLLNAPRIGIAKTVNGKDVWVGWVDVPKNNIGAVTIKGNMGGCDDRAKDFAHLPEGDYKIYFRDCSSIIHRPPEEGSTEYRDDWPEINMTDPIAIKIVNPKVKNDKPYKYKYEFNDVWYKANGTLDNYLTLEHSKVSGWFSLDRTVFYKGEDIDFSYYFSERVGGPSSDRTIWVGIRRPNEDESDSHLKYVNMNGMSGNSKFSASDLSALEAGQYQLVVTDYNFEQARIQGSIMAVMDIVILPAEAKSNPPQVTLNYGQPDDNEETPTVFNPCSSSVPAYGLKKEKVSINVTADDVKRGYVEFKYELENLVPNMNIVYTTEMFYERFGYDPNFIYERQGDYLYFGLYPQTLKPENVNIFLKDGPNEQGYYKGSDGYLYAQVMADSSVSGYKFSNDSQILSGITYYFRVEPLKWRIVGESDGDMTVICESIINAMEYGDSNNYEESAVRAWLANEFYNTAFNERQKALIKIVNVDNSACANTDDKIYLPSYSNVKNYAKAEVLSKTSTDFARVVGSYVDLLGKGNWMLRSPLDSATLKVSGYDYRGRLYDTNVDDASNGVVPMLKLSYKFDDPNIQAGGLVYTVPPPGDRYGVTGGSSYGVSHDNVLTSNFAITKGTSAVNAATYPGASISVDKVYYEYGEDIPIKYRTPSKSGKYRVYITMDEKGSAGRYGTWVVKAYNVNANTQGVVNLSNMSTELHSYVVPNDTQYWNTLPPGEYKIWLYDDRYTNHYGTAYNQYHAGSAFITESLSIKILPPGEYNPDFSVTHYSDWEYLGTKHDDPVRLDWTSLTLDKTVFKQGEKIRYYIDGSWEHKWVGVFNAETFSMNCNIVENYSGYGKTLRYAQWGHKDYINAGLNYLETETLTPGQYKVVYAFGKNLEGAWTNTGFGSDHGDTSQKVMTVIDITILPENCGEQIVTVNYTKADGTAGETSISHPIHFFTPISFDTVLDSVRPGSSITFTTTTTGNYQTEKIIRTNVSAINYQDADAEKPYIRQGDYVYFGEYPQSLKADSVTVYTEDRTDARGYYRGSDGFYYAAVTATPYNSSGYTFKNGSVYYFKVEPIKWRIVSEDQDQNMVLICESILQNNMFDATENTWRTSDIREWLNNYFIDKAFINLQKSYILNTSIDDENDKLYLPSKDNVLNPEYEFDSDASAWDTNRQKLVTDYARATGAFADMTGDEGSGNGIWMLRTPADNSATNFICDVSQHGEVTNGGILVNNMAYGVAPMLKLSYSKDAASAINDIEYSTSSNFAVEHQAFSYVPTKGGAATTKYPGSKLSLPSMYFEYGQPIEVSYKVPNDGKTYRVVVTKEFFNKGETDDKGTPLYDKYVIAGKNLYATVSIKYTKLYLPEGTVDLNEISAYDSPFLQEDYTRYSGNLPVGTYKVWLVKADADMLGWIDDKTGAVHGHAFAQDPYTYIAPNMVTEPITINVVNPEDPNFGIMSNVYSVNNGKNQVAGVEKHDSTRIGIDKTTFVQGERIYFHIQLDYSFRHIMLMKADLSITDVANEPTKGNYDRAMYGKTWRYAVDGYTNGEDFLDTTGLEPGHYKLYYLMGRDLQAAIRGDRFYHDGDPTLAANETYSELLTVIDIIILPKDATQTLTVTYTKYDGSTATITESFPMTGKALGTELHNDKLLTKYHSGIDFVKIVTDAQPGTSFVFTVTTNFNAASDEVKKYFEDRFTCTVLKESEEILS